MNGWRLRLFVGVERLLARLGLKLPGKIMYIGERHPAAASVQGRGGGADRPSGRWGRGSEVPAY